MTQLRATVILVSDAAAAGEDAGRGAPLAVELLEALGSQVDSRTVGNDPSAVAGAVRAALEDGSRLVLACGGTGIGPKDQTPEAVQSLLGFEIPGIAEEIRRRGIANTGKALISRVVAGVVRGDRPDALVLAIPSTRGGIRDTFAVLGDQFSYILGQLDGDGHS